uniref:Uncharacterized protein n=1 Tax=Rhizophora mucronata TaxID=61149 RepID=A0A2P2NMC6_RHIMU
MTICVCVCIKMHKAPSLKV